MGSPDLPDSAKNGSHVYAALRDDIINGNIKDDVTAPNFRAALELSHLIDDVLASAALGRGFAPTATWPR